MSVEKDYEIFTSDEERLKKYNEAITTLRQIGFFNLIRRLAEPERLDVKNERVMEVAAIRQFYITGFYDAIELFFDILSIQGEFKETKIEPDFGANEVLEKHFGFKE
jgi:hypothetical protein